MGTFLIKEGDRYNIPLRYFECDSDTDLNAITTTYLDPGTRVYVIETQKYYILDSSKTWVETSGLVNFE